MTDPLAHLIARYPELEPCRPTIQEIFGAMSHSLSRGGKLLLCGNGGSAADAEHWSGELLKGFAKKRSLRASEKANLPAAIADKLQGALPAIPLTSFPAFTTAFGNDVDPELTFAQLVWALGKPGDVLVGITTSGDASNVCAAMEVAKAKGLIRISLTGESGGKILALSDHCLRVPARETYRAQEYHLPVYHCLSMMLEDGFFPEE